MKCGECQAANRDSARFCGECGAPLPRQCASCGAALDPKLKFCDECGTPAGAAEPPSDSSSAPASEPTRKTVTALFADLVGSTSFGERTDAEVARSVMARYYALMRDAIGLHDGTVAKFMGDGIMATFGIPEIAEDDAVRAVRAGIEIQRRFTDFAAEVAQQHAETLGLRVGVNTGEIVIATGDADLVGDAVNVAARIEHACRPGFVTVGEETWRLTRGEFAYESLGEVTVAGRAQPVVIYEVGADATIAVETAAPFVGRQREMAALRAAFVAATDTRSARLVTVLGSPGVGKTRLSRELCAATSAHDDAITFEIRCDRAGDATFAPVAQLIRDATGLGDDADAESARDRLGALLADDEADRDRLVDILAGLVGAAPARSIEETFWAVRRLVSATAAARPMVVVIDDIQWAEPLLLDLLEHLAEWVHDVPLLIVCLARPELREVRPSLAERNRRVEDVLALDGLDAAATEQLAAGLLGTDRLPAGLVERLPASTDGNPLFVRELVRMLVDDEVIRRRGDEWELAIDAEAVEVPPTIQSLLAARVERLPHEERSLLELASVIGAEFNLGALRELVGTRTSLPALLESMRRKELVEPTGTYWGDEPVHRFHHVLIRDAAYRRLLKTTRADLHEKVAIWTDAAAARLIGEHEAVIAFHYEQAYRYRAELGNLDDHATDLGRRAAELLATAADRSLGRDDLAAAGALAGRALALLPDSDAARTQLLLIACECTLASGDVVGARRVVDQLRVEARDDPTLGAWGLCFEAQLVGLTDPDGLVTAEATATGAAKVMEELGDGAGQAKAHQVRAELLARLGRVGDAELELDLALGAARQVDDRRRVTAVLGAAPNAALWGPSPVARAGGRCLDVVRLLRITTASPSVEATSMRCQAALEALRGRFDVARSMLASSRATLEELGLRHGLLETAYLTGVVELVAGDPAAAIEPLRDAYAGLIEMGVGIDAGRAAALLAHALVAVGRIDDAEPMAAASEELAGQDLKTAIGWRGARAEVLAARGDLARGIALATEAVDIAAATDLVIDHADACVTLAALHEQANDATAAQLLRAEAKRLYDLKGASVPALRLAGNAISATATIAAPAPAPLPSAPPTLLERAHADPRNDRAENLAETLGTQLFEHVSAGRMDRARALFSDDAVSIDKRSIIGMELVGGDNIIASLQAAVDLGLVAMWGEPLAVRGSTLALGRIIVDFAGYVIRYLNVGQLDDNGRFSHIIGFDEDALADALDEIDARYFAGEGRDVAIPAQSILAGFAATNRRDWAGLANGYTPEFSQVDRRQLGWPTVDAEGLIAMLQGYVELAPDLFLLARKHHAHNDTVLVTIDGFGTTADGNVMEWVQHYVATRNELGTSHGEIFDEHEFSTALARLDELGATEPRHPRAENRASALGSRLWERFATGEMDQVRALLADDAVSIDRRSIIGMDLFGGDAMVASLQETGDLGVVGARWEPLAIRGSTLVLGRITIQFGSFEIVFLIVGELNDDELLSYSVNFDEDALADALGELDARYFAGAGSDIADATEALVGGLAAINRRDWATLLDTYGPGFTQIDHRQLGWPTVDADGVIAMLKGYVELAPDVFLLARKYHVHNRAVLVTLDVSGTSTDGNVVEWVQHYVGTADEHGTLAEIYADDEFGLALARLDGLGAAPPSDARHPRAENSATTVGAGFWELYVAGEMDHVRALLADDAVLVDTRSIIGIDQVGGDAIVENLRASIDLGLVAARVEPLAVRGSTLSLGRITTQFGDFESVFFNLGELDADGLISYIAVFDEDALVDAIAELDARYFAGEGRDLATAVQGALAGFAAVNRREWVNVVDFYSPEFSLVDHRQLGWPTVDREGLVTMLQGYVDLAPDLFLLSRNHHAHGRAVLVTLDGFGTTPDGNAIEWAQHYVCLVEDHGTTVADIYAEQEFDAALARLDELGAERPADSRHARVENEMTRIVDTFFARAIDGGFDDAAEVIALDIVRVDRRTAVSDATTHGRTEYMAALRATFAVGFAAVTVDHVAVRGERLALFRSTFTTDSGMQLVILSVGECNGDGRVSSLALFDEGAFDAAVAELDDRYVAGEGAEHADRVRHCIAVVRASDARDYDTIRLLSADDAVFVEHRQFGWPSVGVDEYIDILRSYGDLRLSSALTKIFVADHAALYRVEITGADADENEGAWSVITLIVFDTNRRACRCETFDVDDFAAALARFDELATAPATGRRAT